MSSSSQNQVRRIREVTPGTTPAGSMTTCPWTDFSFTGAIERETPGDVRADRETADNPATNVTPAASGTCDFAYGNHDLEVSSAFCREKTATATYTASTISAAATGNLLEDSADGFTAFEVGDLVVVEGMTTNGTLFAALILSKANDGELGIDTDLKTLVNEAAGASITIRHSGLWYPGTSLLTSTYETWNSSSSKGQSMAWLGVSQWGFTVPHPSKCTENFTFVGGALAARIDAQLANATAVGAFNAGFNSNIHFGDALNPNAGFGLRFGGAAIQLRVKNFSLTLTNPIAADGGAGVLGPQDIALDDRRAVRVEFTFTRTGSSDGEDMIDAARNVNTAEPLSFGFRDAAGNRKLIYLPEVQPAGGDVTGVRLTGRDEATISLMARTTSTYGSIRVADFAA